MSPLPVFPTRPAWKKYPSPEPIFMPSSIPKRAPVKRDATFPEPSFHYFSKVPAKGPLSQVPQRDHYGQRHQSIEPSTYHPLNILLSFRVPGKEASNMFSNTVGMERDTSSSELLAHLFCYVFQSP